VFNVLPPMPLDVPGSLDGLLSCGEPDPVGNTSQQRAPRMADLTGPVRHHM
jgi:hypothetical protein